MAMLKLVGETTRKQAAQVELERIMRGSLETQGEGTVGFPGGSVDLPIYSMREGGLWAAFGGPTRDASVRRYWNAFGVYQSSRSAQTISVEINIPIDSNDSQVAGFFAEDVETGEIFLMHSGRVGGGRPGISKSAFLVWSKAKPVEVADGDGGIRKGIAVGRLHNAELTERIWAFVKTVQSFKDQATKGALETAEFNKQVEEFDRYSKEFSGKKKGMHGGSFEYVTYHGDIVHKLYEERAARLSQGENVFNSDLIDLYVKRDGSLTEVYEVKTGVGRQMLYTAIGQILTHAGGRDKIEKCLVVPASESIPPDIQQAITMLGIKIRRFRLQKVAYTVSIEFE